MHTRHTSYCRTWPFYVFEMTNIVNSSSDDENHILNDAMANTEQYNAVGDDRLNVLDIVAIIAT